ncbi:unnamed protein product [Caenorhabditis angaria]|uniref:SET domain-containing protein n=1 Tax=Caenorhabditis angaria TaxID=860376 RepID=A0A9P1MWF3_9PELO|nr:unnamed protein product [Caenorhabditis angaria]
MLDWLFARLGTIITGQTEMSDLNQNISLGSKNNPISLDDSSDESDSGDTIASEEFVPSYHAIRNESWRYIPRKPTRGRPKGTSISRDGKTFLITSKNIKRGRPRKGSIRPQKFKRNLDSTNKPAILKKGRKRRKIKRQSVVRQETPANIPEVRRVQKKDAEEGKGRDIQIFPIFKQRLTGAPLATIDENIDESTPSTSIQEENQSIRQETPTIPEVTRVSIGNEEMKGREISPIFEQRLVRTPFANINEDGNQSTSATSQEDNQNENTTGKRLIMGQQQVGNFRKRGPKRYIDAEKENDGEIYEDFEHNDIPEPLGKRRAPPVDSDSSVNRNVLKNVILDEVFNSNHENNETPSKQCVNAEKLVPEVLQIDSNHHMKNMKSPEKSANVENLVQELLENEEIEELDDEDDSKQDASKENDKQNTVITDFKVGKVRSCERGWESVWNNSEVGMVETGVREDDGELRNIRIEPKCYGNNVQPRPMKKDEAEDENIVIKPNPAKLLFSHNYKFQLRKSQKEAIRGEQLGDIDWVIQAIHETSDSNKFFVLYEGWTAETGSFHSLKQLKRTAPIMLAECRSRSKIIRAIEQQIGSSLRHNFGDLRKYPNNLFWALEDMTYFQNEKRKDRKNISTVFYLSTASKIKEVPNFVYINKNIVERNTEKMINNNQNSVNIDEWMSKSVYIANDGKSSCSSPDCKCNTRQELVYNLNKGLEDHHRLKFRKNGSLDLSKFKIEERRYIIECSDACGCGSLCPSRRIQQGQTIPLVISYENFEKGYGVRAGSDIKRGEFICEYTGVARKVNPKRDDKYSLEFGIVLSNCAIDAMNYGNVARFMNHSCTPNSMYVEAHTRVNETSPLLPRVGIFSIEDIAIGEEITVSYYTIEALKNAAKRSTGKYKCFCKSKNCLGWMPKFL